MNCQICLNEINDSQDSAYHANCLKKLFGNTKVPTRLNYDRQEFKLEVKRAVQEGRMSISGVQPKAQMTLESPSGPLIVIKSGGEYILKPTPEEFPDAAINEQVSMLMAQKAGFDIPPVGLISFKSGEEQAYVIRRFDRFGDKKLHHEDMMQTLGLNNNEINAKYDSATYLDILLSIKMLAGGAVATEFFRRVVFNYFIGNDDFHLKNISLMHGDVIKLTPMYDCLNSQIYSGPTHSPLALRLTDDDQSLPYYGSMANGRYGLDDFIVFATKGGILEKPARKIIGRLTKLHKDFTALVASSNLTEEYKQKYIELLDNRHEVLNYSLADKGNL